MALLRNISETVSAILGGSYGEMRLAKSSLSILGMGTGIYFK